MIRGAASPSGTSARPPPQIVPVSRAEASVRWLLAFALALGFAHSVYRAGHLGIEYFDGYDYLSNARALAGDPLAEYQRLRPPFVPIIQLPAMAVVRASRPAAPVRLLAPHLTSVIVSILSAGAVLWLFFRSFGATLALLGTLLFVATRYFVHYGPHVMADIPSAGWAAATLALYLRARERSSTSSYALCGLALGASVLTKYPLIVLGPALALAELGLAAVARRMDRRGWVGIGIIGAFSAAFFLGVQVVVMMTLYGADWLAILGLTLARFTTMSGIGALPGESWRDYGAMSVAMLSLPTLLLCGAGILLALWRREARDIPFLTSLACLAGSTLFVLRHNEARYLLPAVPFILYFALRSIEVALGGLRAHWTGLRWPSRAIALSIGAALLGSALRVGVHQALLDEDPVYRADAERRAAERLLAARRGDGRLLWYGHWHTLRTRWAGLVPHDEYMGIFHYPAFAARYFLDRRVDPMPAPHASRTNELALVLEDGDAILRTGGRAFDARLLLYADVPPMEVWSAQRLRFRARGTQEFASETDPRLRVRLHPGAHGADLSANALSGTWHVLIEGASEASRRYAGTVALRPGVAVPLAYEAAEPVRTIELFRIQRTRID